MKYASIEHQITTHGLKVIKSHGSHKKLSKLVLSPLHNKCSLGDYQTHSERHITKNYKKAVLGLVPLDYQLCDTVSMAPSAKLQPSALLFTSPHVAHHQIEAVELQRFLDVPNAPSYSAICQIKYNTHYEPNMHYSSRLHCPS